MFDRIPDHYKTGEVYYFMGVLIVRNFVKFPDYEDFFGMQSNESYDLAKEYFEKSFKLGFKESGFELGYGYYKRYFDAENDIERFNNIIKYVTPFADEGSYLAMDILGYLYLHGYTITGITDYGKCTPGEGRDFEKAFKYHKALCELGKKDLYFTLASMYEYGLGTKKDKDMAIYYYRKAWYEHGILEATECIDRLEGR